MDFKTALRDGCCCLNLGSNTKREVIEEMIDLMVASGKLKDREEALNAVLEREEKMSTGVQHGVAIPHGKLSSIDSLITAFAIKREGIDFGSLDGEPSRIFVMTLSSNLRTGPHLQFLSEICKVLNSAEVRERLLAAKSVEEVIQLLTS
jgi:fructose-specific phosphotransferase system IIA component